MFDDAGRLTDTYGPTQAAYIGADGKPAQIGTNQYGSPIYGAMPHTSTAYDQTWGSGGNTQINGLATTWYPNTTLAGPSVQRSATTTLPATWATTPVTGHASYSGTMTGY